MFCYDITDHRRLNKIAKTLEKYGIRIQKSFFQCNVNKETADKIKRAILKIMDSKVDSFFIYPICDRCVLNTVSDGEGDIINLEPFEIL